MNNYPDSFSATCNEYIVKTNDKEHRVKATKMFVDTDNNRLMFWKDKLIVAIFAMDVVEYFMMV